MAVHRGDNFGSQQYLFHQIPSHHTWVQTPITWVLLSFSLSSFA
jgi:hypothetical protein